jgi:stalled ribosome alternative rescue factor ArfA
MKHPGYRPGVNENRTLRTETRCHSSMIYRCRRGLSSDSSLVCCLGRPVFRQGQERKACQRPSYKSSASVSHGPEPDGWARRNKLSQTARQGIFAPGDILPRLPGLEGPGTSLAPAEVT